MIYKEKFLWRKYVVLYDIQEDQITLFWYALENLKLFADQLQFFLAQN